MSRRRIGVRVWVGSWSWESSGGANGWVIGEWCWTPCPRWPGLCRCIENSDSSQPLPTGHTQPSGLSSWNDGSPTGEVESKEEVRMEIRVAEVVQDDIRRTRLHNVEISSALSALSEISFLRPRSIQHPWSMRRSSRRMGVAGACPRSRSPSFAPSLGTALGVARVAFVKRSRLKSLPAIRCFSSKSHAKLNVTPRSNQ